MSTTSSLMTFAEFEQLPDLEAGKRELVDGELITMPPPELNHSTIAQKVLHFLSSRMDWRRVWPDHTGYGIGGGWFEPDVSVSWPDQRRDEKYFVGSPMVAIEILSPGEEIERKLTLYFEDGAAEVWIIDPRRRTMVVYAREEGNVVRRAATGEHHSNALGITIPLTEIFGAQ